MLPDSSCTQIATKVILIFKSVVIVRHHCTTHTKHKTFSYGIIMYIYFCIHTNHSYMHIYIYIDIISPDSRLPGQTYAIKEFVSNVYLCYVRILTLLILNELRLT